MELSIFIRLAQSFRVLILSSLLSLLCLPAAFAQSSLSISWTGAGGDGNWFNVLNWSPTTVPRSIDTVFISLGSVTMPPSAQFRALNLSGGVLDGAASITTTVNWSGGRINASLTLTSNSFLNLTGTGEKILSAGTFVNGGRIIWSGTGLVRVSGSTSITNLAGSLIEIQSDVTMAAEIGAIPRIVNHGLIRKSGGPGASAINGIPVVNNGMLEVLTGTLAIGSSYNNVGESKVSSGALNLLGGGRIGGTWSTATGVSIALMSGAYDLVSNAIYNGPGSFGVKGSVILNGPLTRREFDLAGTIAGTLSVSGRINWSSGQIGATLTIVPGGALNLIGSEEKTLEGSTVNNSGTITWGGTGGIHVNRGTIITNHPSGIFEIVSDETLSHDSDDPPKFVNHGTLRKISGPGISTLNGIPFTNNGIVETLNGTLVFGGSFINTGETKIQVGKLNLMGGGRIAGTWAVGAGASANLTGGSFDLDANALFNGPGSFNLQGILTLNGTLSRKEVQLAGSVSGAFTITGTMNWIEGAIGADFTIAPGGIVNLLGNGEKMFEGGEVRNAGSIIWAGPGRISVNEGTIFTNQSGGLFEIQVDSVMEHELGAQPVFVNNGSFRKSSGTGSASINGISFVNNGTVTVNSGTLNIGGEFLNSGSTRIESGSLNLGGGGTIYGFWSAGSGTSINLVGGTFHLSSSALFNGPGVFGVSGNVAFDGTLVFPNFRLSGVVTGTFELTGSITGDFTLDGVMNWTQGQINGKVAVAPGAFVNLSGKLDKTFSGTVFNNRGTITWSDSGRIRYSNGAIVTNLPGGVIDLRSESTMWHDAGAVPRIVNQGTFRKSTGVGTTSITGIPFSNSGSLEVLSGALRLEQCELQEEGTIRFTCASDSVFGRLMLPGEISLRGGLDLVFLEPFRFWPSVTVIPLSYNSHVGTFTHVSGQHLPTDAQISADYRPTSVAVTVNPVPPAVVPGKSVYTLGEPISIDFEDTPGNPKDRIAIFPQGASPASAQPVLWSYVDGSQTGTNGLKEGSVAFPTGLGQVGRWVVYLLWNDQTNIISQSAFQTVPAYSISLSTSPIDGGSATGSGTFPAGSAQVVRAIPSENYSFVSWTEGGSVVSTAANYSFDLEANRTLVANFIPKPVQVTINSQPEGRSLIVDGETFVAPRTFTWTPGTRHTLSSTSPQPTVDEKTRYLFDSWSDGLDQTHEIVLPFSPGPYTARFTTQFLLETEVTPEGSGSISANPPGPWLDAGQAVVLTALPATSYALTAWSGADSQNGMVAQVLMAGPRKVSAAFEVTHLEVGIRISAPLEVTLTFTANSNSVYRVESSSDLDNWSTLATISNRAGEVSYSEFDLPPNSRRFYRVARQ